MTEKTDGKGLATNTQFKKATRYKVPLKVALTGPSGSGKTYSALLLMRGIVGKKGRIALIDTEAGSASLYASLTDFDTLVITPPFTVEKYIRAMEAAIEEGYNGVVIDSISHVWAGEGGLLDQKSSLDARGSNSFTSWGKITPLHEKFKSMILQSMVHVVCTMRSKQDYILELNDKGKQAPRKVGLAPVQRDGIEYEFTTVFDIAMDHQAAVSKDRTNLFDNQIFKITSKTGEKLTKWLDGGVDIPDANNPESSPDTPPTPEARPTFNKRVTVEAKRLGKDLKWIKATMKAKYDKSKGSDFTPDEQDEFITYLAGLTVEEVAV